MKIINILRGRGKVVSIFVVLVVAVMLFSACEKDDDVSGTGEEFTPKIVDYHEEFVNNEDNCIDAAFNEDAEDIIDERLPGEIEVSVSTEDGDTEQDTVEVEWKEPEGFEVEKPGEYSFIGEVNYKGYEDSIKVVVKVHDEGACVLEIKDFSEQFKGKTADEEIGEVKITLNDSLGVENIEGLVAKLVIKDSDGNEVLSDEDYEEEIESLENEEIITFDVGRITKSGEFTAEVSVGGEDEDIDEVVKSEEFEVSAGEISGKNSYIGRGDFSKAYDNTIETEITLKDEYDNPVSGKFNVYLDEEVDGDEKEIYSAKDVGFGEDGNGSLSFKAYNDLDNVSVKVGEGEEDAKMVDDINGVYINKVANHNLEESYDSLSQAIEEAEEGHEIEVFDYADEGTLEIETEGLTLESNYGDNPQAILGNVKITADNVTLSGFKIAGDEEALDGCGIEVEGAEGVVIEDNDISGFENGIRTEESSVVIEDNMIAETDWSIIINGEKGNTDSNSKIIDNSINDSEYGVKIEEVNGIKINDNNFLEVEKPIYWVEENSQDDYGDFIIERNTFNVSKFQNDSNIDYVYVLYNIRSDTKNKTARNILEGILSNNEENGNKYLDGDGNELEVGEDVVVEEIDFDDGYNYGIVGYGPEEEGEE
ncbi:MAG: NosD domain-containing protein [Halanaerobiales bacterium]